VNTLQMRSKPLAGPMVPAFSGAGVTLPVQRRAKMMAQYLRPSFSRLPRSRWCRTLSPCAERSRARRRTERARRSLSASRATGISCRADSTDDHRDTVHSAGVIRMNTISTEAIVAPTACPFCNSVDVTTTSKAVNVSTYWRCIACGQIWNVGRLQYGHRTLSGRFG
jgi:hypothetical protein